MSITTNIDLLKHRRTKIVATLGPSSSDRETITRLLCAGANVIRLNMSHGDHAAHRMRYETVRSVAAGLGQHIAVFADLCGPKIRTGRFAGGQIRLDAGSCITVTTRDVIGESGLVPSQYESLAHDVAPGDRIMLDDGALELRVEQVDGTEIRCKVIHGGTLRDHKGINLPGVNVSAPSLTEKDRADAAFALALGVDFIALSFVRAPEDVHALRDLIAGEGGEAGIIAKIERPEALRNASAIIEAADAIMVARGDLGVELNLEQVPLAQTELIARARALARPVIVATQMLESMIDSARPTRAEVSDVSHAVASGADAVMLSGETAAGRFPVETVEMMVRIVRQTEAYHLRRRQWGSIGSRHPHADPKRFGDAVAEAASQLAHDLEAKAIIVISQSGRSAVTVTARRPTASIVGVTPFPRVANRMSLMWGMLPVVDAEVGATNPNQVARRIAREHELAGNGEYILLVRGFHSDPVVNTPSITMLIV
ncbi:MAG: Pyruvate kinase [Gammaproteobacteria bacterium]|nr:Pyruvate kinase [Gammaproteobacteria bacterium]